MLEGLGGQQFDAELVVEAIAQGEGEAVVVMDIGVHGATHQRAVVGVGLDLGHTDAGIDVALAVGGKGLAACEGAAGDGGDQSGGDQGVAHGVLLAYWQKWASPIAKQCMPHRERGY